MKNKKYCKVSDHWYYIGGYRGGVHSICNLKYSLPKKMSTVFHNGFNYNYHFIIKELAKEFEKRYTCIGGNTEKYITFSVRIEKEVTRIDKNGEDIANNISYRFQFIESTKFMASPLIKSCQ